MISEYGIVGFRNKTRSYAELADRYKKGRIYRRVLADVFSQN